MTERSTWPCIQRPIFFCERFQRSTEYFKAQAATSFGMTTPVPLPASELRQAAAPATADAGMLEFDLESLSLDLGGDTEQPVIAAAPATTEDPLATKLALAEEISAIGDADGARALIEEVIEEATARPSAA